MCGVVTEVVVAIVVVVVVTVMTVVSGAVGRPGIGGTGGGGIGGEDVLADTGQAVRSVLESDPLLPYCSVIVMLDGKKTTPTSVYEVCVLSVLLLPMFVSLLFLFI